MLNTQWLQTFITLVEVGHFTQTAEKLFMTQPGVSQHIKKLEAQTGTPLLERFGKRFELTPAGETLYHYARRRRDDELALFQALQNDDPFTGECRIACSGSLATYLYPHFLKHQQTHPNLAIQLEAAPNKRILDNLNTNQIELGIITQNVAIPELEQEKVGAEQLCLVIPAGMEKVVINMEQLNQLGFINHPDGEHYVRQIIQANFDHSFNSIDSLKVAGYINQLNQILLPVSLGLGYTVLPEKAVTCFPLQTKIHVVSLDKPVYENLYLIRKKHRPLPKRYDFFMRQIRTLLS
ncbi:LysR family transcriptional regulator [Photobacterium proteolyticum]|uniref:LysR family transcriptional regulator n=1 Tax=Photobacterium proteolyticum TaxID=1903952 RepID=A0A1Q9G9T5_9GAMM|nr:LysR family transcriptional regulator [Photobacterium proteolyticum]OLQ71101.1 LysR family transcriptional regulator [Photobacterium proteolyticum]